MDQTLQPGEQVLLPKSTSHHLCTVLRLQAGSAVTLFNGDGYNYPTRLHKAGKQASVDILDKQINATESPIALELIQGISRGDRMDTTIQKAVELGVTAVHPVMTEKSAVRLSGDRLKKKLAHWQGIIISACEQSGRSCLPTLSEPQSLSEWLSQNDADNTDELSGIHWLLLPGATEAIGSVDSPASPCLTNPDRTKPYRVLIGPESGLSDKEIESCLSAGFKPLSIGPRILRTETAGPAAIAILQSRFGDLQ